MDGALVEQFIAQHLRFVVWQPVAIVELLDQGRCWLLLSDHRRADQAGDGHGASHDRGVESGFHRFSPHKK
jgi:hypothetical protein